MSRRGDGGERRHLHASDVVRIVQYGAPPLSHEGLER
eukprot:CAMPEP_0118883544 /NCGR_PEP_ID=MMETSP1163-20130328/22597_1 /TAXON_ID=124430 /ORGANISM="Phaeomonas parva, Strain CCMP2877" /LENGTH=36 /DNA_ID= /DNA_START= /DNA_END= /DNA_ORIENTATION=